MASELAKRLLIGPILAVAAVAAIWYDLGTGRHWGAVALASAAMLTAFREYARLLRPLAPGVQAAPILVIGLLLIGSAWPGPAALGWDPAVPVPSILVSLGFVWIVVVQMLGRGLSDFVANVAASVLGLVYLGLGLYLLTALAALDAEGHVGRGTKLLILAILTCKAGDIFAFFGGRSFGRHKMAPALSPGKTWEGFACAMVGAVGGSYLGVWVIGLLSPPPVFDGWWQPAVWGIVLGPVGVLGDLAESCLKRVAGVKDSGHALPGFGGFLDVFDAVLLAAPVAIVLAQVL